MHKPTTIEYLERRCAINEELLKAVGRLLIDHLPAVVPELVCAGVAWDAAIDKLNDEMGMSK